MFGDQKDNGREKYIKNDNLPPAVITPVAATMMSDLL